MISMVITLRSFVGSALGALNGDPKWEEKVMELMEAVRYLDSAASA